MSWKKLSFGKYEGKSLPQVLFLDPDYFFWAYSENIFKNSEEIFNEAQEILLKSKNIRIPQNGHEQFFAEYVFHPSNGKFCEMRLIPDSCHRKLRSRKYLRKSVIDLSIPHKFSSYDKLGYKLFISNIKYLLFGSRKHKMTKKRCEEFFDNEDNFCV